MEIKSITRNKDYASWTVNYIHEGIEHTVVVNLNSKTSLLESLNSTTIVPPFAPDLIRTALSQKGEIMRSMFNQSVCLIRPENWAK
jgi:hypothetical protein